MFRMLKNNRGTWGAVAGAVVSVGAGAASSYMANESAQDGSMGYDMPMLTNSPWDYTNQQMTAQAAQDQLRNAQIGRLPPGQQILLNNMKKEQMRQAQEQMYGTAGNRGGSIMNNTMAMGAQGGVGPKAMMAQGSKAMNDYAGRNAQIQNYIDSLKFSGLQNSQSQAIQQMQSMPRSNEIPYQGQIVNMSTPGQPGMDTGLQNVDWMKAMNNTGWFDKKTTSTTNPYQVVTPQASQYKPMAPNSSWDKWA